MVRIRWILKCTLLPILSLGVLWGYVLYLDYLERERSGGNPYALEPYLDDVARITVDNLRTGSRFELTSKRDVRRVREMLDYQFVYHAPSRVTVGAIYRAGLYSVSFCEGTEKTGLSFILSRDGILHFWGGGFMIYGSRNVAMLRAVEDYEAKSPDFRGHGAESMKEDGLYLPGIRMVMVRFDPALHPIPSASATSGEAKAPAAPLAPFWVSTHEVTQRQWKMIMGGNPSQCADSGPDAPVDSVSFGDAMEFCARLTKDLRSSGIIREDQVITLPSEGQWNYCFEAGGSSLCVAPSELLAKDWFFQNSGGGSRRVALLQADSIGLYDLVGNSREWCRDLYVFINGSLVPGDLGPFRVVMGRSWLDDVHHYDTSLSSAVAERARFVEIGFRIVLESSGAR